MEELVKLIVKALNASASAMPRGISNEKLFETEFVETVVSDAVVWYERPLRLDGSPSRFEVAFHGWKPRDVRYRDLDEETKKRYDGWTNSKVWSVINAWGRHTPDIAIRDTSSNKTLVIEVKFGDISGRGLPTGELQRMVGQSVLAKLHHAGVIAVFGYRGKLSRRDEVGLETWLRSLGIELVICEVPS